MKRHIRFTTKVIRIGKHLGIIIPDNIVQDLNLKEGEPIQVEIFKVYEENCPFN